MTQKLAIACDHAAYDFKKDLMAHYDGRIEWLDLGCDSNDSVDYPDFGKKLGQAIADGLAEKGIVICGSGIGISIAVNRFPAVRGALCTSTDMATITRQHNDANVLALGARFTDLDTAIACVDAFLDTEFEGGRHARRVDKLNFKP